MIWLVWKQSILGKPRAPKQGGILESWCCRALSTLQFPVSLVHCVFRCVSTTTSPNLHKRSLESVRSQQNIDWAVRRRSLAVPRTRRSAHLAARRNPRTEVGANQRFGVWNAVRGGHARWPEANAKADRCGLNVLRWQMLRSANRGETTAAADGRLLCVVVRPSGRRGNAANGR